MTEAQDLARAERVVASWCDTYYDPTAISGLAEMVADALAAERERCAKIAEAEEELDGDMPDALWSRCTSRDGATEHGPPAVCGCPRGGRRCEEMDRQPAKWAKGLVVLTVAHLCQDSTCADEAHLKAMCNRCHLRLDVKQHTQNSYRTRRNGKAIGDLFDGA